MPTSSARHGAPGHWAPAHSAGELGRDSESYIQKRVRPHGEPEHNTTGSSSARALLLMTMTTDWRGRSSTPSGSTRATVEALLKVARDQNSQAGRHCCPQRRCPAARVGPPPERAAAERRSGARRASRSGRGQTWRALGCARKVVEFDLSEHPPVQREEPTLYS